ncbi:hypothetical protein CPT_Michonne34 [Citrobacter phage Michonne]|uniref:Minor tail protein n=2 Tax=Mooglevirus mordin TaxID=1985305 RepID=A0A0K2CMT2_9CAUD|nr:minor tail protein [Citrobacter phage Michonne]YP_009606634.1 minor tail protein [Citrobacter phage Mordin]AKU43983.1 hypothetical protein CPT_Michonne34 [Citrobacter phage Michonne]ALA06852.1 hypothetical protein Mordin_36 [Citrobacter phage Mordin]AYR00778.1 hypothetical protein CPT_Maleficent_034 [Citrobacter phage Maleficent]
MKTVNEIMEEKGINEAFMLNTVETLAIIMRSNSLSGKFIPESLCLVKDSVENDEDFRKEVEYLLSNQSVALKTIAIGIDAFAAYVFEEMYSGGFIQMTEAGIKELDNMSDAEIMKCICASVASVMASLEKRMSDQSPRYAKLDWGFEEISERVLTLTEETMTRLVQISDGIEMNPVQVQLTSMLNAIFSIMGIHALLEVSKMLEADPAFVEEISQGAHSKALNDVFSQTGAAVLSTKLAINFGDEFVEQLDSMAERELSGARLQ